jgi:hypothetical protein
MRTAHYGAFESLVKARVPALASKTYDGEVPLVDGQPARETYLVLHDMGFDRQDDARLTVTVQDAADGTYRVVVRVVATTRAAVRDVADVVKRALVDGVLTIPGRICGALQLDAGPHPVERDDDVTPPLFWVDLDFTWRSTRA